MNLKHLIIFIVVVLIVLVSYLIFNKQERFYSLSGVVCENLNTYGCGFHSADCAIKRDINNNEICKDKCRFDPVNPSETTYQSFGMVVNPPQGDEPPEYYFENEEQNGIFSECFSKCTNINKEQGIENSYCDSTDCQSKCQAYLTSRVEKIGSADIKYMPYPTNRLEQVNYDELRGTIVNQMDGALKQNIQNTIFQDSINTEVSEQVDLQEESTKLNNVISVLKNLNSTGNNFIQQVDQLGEFQDKYSQKIEELLEGKANADTNLDSKIDVLQNKLEELNKFYQLFNTNVNSNTSRQVNSVYKSVTCLANGISFNVLAVYYSKDGSYVNYRNGVYCITLTQGSETGYLYVEPKKESSDDPTQKIYCNPYEEGCSYELSLGGATRDNGDSINDADNILEIDLQNENIFSGKYSDSADVSYSPLNFQFKRQGYFHIREIKSNDDYNSILISTPAGTKNLIKNEQIKYPFYVIESVEKPGYLINVSKSSTSNDYNLFLRPANKSGTEKYSVSTAEYNDANNCSATTN